MPKIKIKGDETPLPMSERPICLWCGKPLAAYFKKEWPVHSQKALYKSFEGYGRLGNGKFCNLSHGYRWAVWKANGKL